MTQSISNQLGIFTYKDCLEMACKLDLVREKRSNGDQTYYPLRIAYRYGIVDIPYSEIFAIHSPESTSYLFAIITIAREASIEDQVRAASLLEIDGLWFLYRSVKEIKKSSEVNLKALLAIIIERECRLRELVSASNEMQAGEKMLARANERIDEIKSPYLKMNIEDRFQELSKNRHIFDYKGDSVLVCLLVRSILTDGTHEDVKNLEQELKYLLRYYPGESEEVSLAVEIIQRICDDPCVAHKKWFELLKSWGKVDKVKRAIIASISHHPSVSRSDMWELYVFLEYGLHYERVFFFSWHRYRRQLQQEYPII